MVETSSYLNFGCVNAHNCQLVCHAVAMSLYHNIMFCRRWLLCSRLSESTLRINFCQTIAECCYTCVMSSDPGHTHTLSGTPTSCKTQIRTGLSKRDTTNDFSSYVARGQLKSTTHAQEHVLQQPPSILTATTLQRVSYKWNLLSAFSP